MSSSKGTAFDVLYMLITQQVPFDFWVLPYKAVEARQPDTNTKSIAALETSLVDHILDNLPSCVTQI